jgi:acid phosphatase class B
MKLALTLSTVLCAGMAFTVQSASASAATQEQKAPSEKTEKESKWQGKVLRVYEGESKLDIRGGEKASASEVRVIAFDSSTKWTKLNKDGGKQSDVKDGSFIIVLGHVDDKGVMHATRIDLRLPR